MGSTASWLSPVSPPGALRPKGTSGAVFELAIIMAPPIGRALAEHPRCRVTIRIDDIGLSAADVGPRRVVKVAALGWAALKAALEEAMG